MNWVKELFSNQFLMTGLSSWFVAQVLKVIIHGIINQKFDIMRLFGDGGMPSGHSATVASVAASAALVYGPGSFQFAISAILAVIVCHDAVGVRLETGKQAVLINELMKVYETIASKDLPEVKLKEFVGHTPIQVTAGILIGIVNAMVLHYFVF